MNSINIYYILYTCYGPDSRIVIHTYILPMLPHEPSYETDREDMSYIPPFQVSGIQTIAQPHNLKPRLSFYFRFLSIKCGDLEMRSSNTYKETILATSELSQTFDRGDFTES